MYVSDSGKSLCSNPSEAHPRHTLSIKICPQTKPDKRSLQLPVSGVHINLDVYVFWSSALPCDCNLCTTHTTQPPIAFGFVAFVQNRVNDPDHCRPTFEMPWDLVATDCWVWTARQLEKCYASQTAQRQRNMRPTKLMSKRTGTQSGTLSGTMWYVWYVWYTLRN